MSYRWLVALVLMACAVLPIAGRVVVEGNCIAP